MSDGSRAPAWIGASILIMALLSACGAGSASPAASPDTSQSGAASPSVAGSPGASADASGGVTITASPNFVDDDGRFFTIDEVGLGAEGYVTLRNFTGVSASLAGLYLCEAPDCAALPDIEVEAGATALMAMGEGSGLADPVATKVGLDLQPSGGEVGLYASDKTGEAGDIRAYIDWGSTPHEGTATAIEAGLWLEGSYVPSSASAARIFRSDTGAWVAE